MPDDFKPGLEGVIAFETEIAEPDKEGGSLRYRGVDIEDLVGHVSYGNVWGLLVDDRFWPGLPPAEPFPIPVHSGDVRVDVQSAVAMLAPVWGLRPLLDVSDEQARDDLARVSVMMLSYVAQAARGIANSSAYCQVFSVQTSTPFTPSTTTMADSTAGIASLASCTNMLKPGVSSRLILVCPHSA